MDNSNKPCDCKGRRTCLLCENLLDKKPRNFFQEFQELKSVMYCSSCQQIFQGWNVFPSCQAHEGLTGREFPGVFIEEEFLSVEDSDNLVKGVDDTLGWDASQSGRRKKNNGPKVNFKKKKLAAGKFEGFPRITKFLRDRLKNVKLLHDFVTIEECFLEYNATRGSHIEPHIDDCWIWGERVVTVNCIGDSVLTLTKHNPLYPQQYNLDLVDEYKNQLIGSLQDFIADDVVVRIPMPAKSLLVLYGPPRYQYEHSVLREDINERRVAIAYREFTVPYLKSNAKYEEAQGFYDVCETTGF